ncbi:MAG: lipocalin-like domain-containing protein [bacterium]|nr:lipocalin-like domain-containing protein [bacterium]
MNKDKILGSWRLQNFNTEDESGNIFYPLGKSVDGLIMYTSDGYMSANIIALSMKECISEGINLKNLHQGKGSYLSYSGSYTLHEDRVIHHVKVSLIPEWIDGDQERFYRIENNKLTITSFTENKDGSVFKHTLIWKKCSS